MQIYYMYIRIYRVHYDMEDRIYHFKMNSQKIKNIIYIDNFNDILLIKIVKILKFKFIKMNKIRLTLIICNLIYKIILTSAVVKNDTEL